MTPVPDAENSGPLRALRAARPHVDTLRTTDFTADEGRQALLGIANAVEGCLRLLQRDARLAGRSREAGIPAPDAPLEDVFAEVCRDYSLNLALASEIDDVLGIRRRIQTGGEVDVEDVDDALDAYERLRAEVQRIAVPPERVRPIPPSARASGDPARGAPVSGAATTPAPAADPRPAQTRSEEYAEEHPGPRRGWLTLILLILILGAGAAAIFWPRSDDGGEMEQGIALFSEQRYADAASHFWRASEANPSDIDPQLYLARIHRRMGRPELAEQALAAAEAIDPSDPAVAAERGLLALDADNPEGALSYSREAVRVEPEAPAGWIALVRSLWETGRVDEAAEALQDAPAELQPALDLPDGP